MWDEAVDDSLAALKVISDWFVTSKTIKKLYTLCSDENILHFNENSRNVVFSCNEMGIFNIHLHNINFDNKFDEDDPNTTILIKLLDWHIKFEKPK